MVSCRHLDSWREKEEEREVGRREIVHRNFVLFVVLFWSLDFWFFFKSCMSGWLGVVCETHLDVLVEMFEKIQKYIQFREITMKENSKIRAHNKDKKYEKGNKNERNVSEE